MATDQLIVSAVGPWSAPPGVAPVGVIHGRFQPLHLGHLEYLLAGKRACETLIVGITNPDPGEIVFEPSDPERGKPAANPCTYYERHLMIEGALLDSGIELTAFRIAPFPHSHPDRLLNYVPKDALFLLTIYDAWGETKLRRLADLQLKTHVLWRRNSKVTSGSEVRRRILTNESWEHLVPPAVARVIRQFAIDERIRASAS